MFARQSARSVSWTDSGKPVLCEQQSVKLSLAQEHLGSRWQNAVWVVHRGLVEARDAPVLALVPQVLLTVDTWRDVSQIVVASKTDSDQRTIRFARYRPIGSSQARYIASWSRSSDDGT